MLFGVRIVCFVGAIDAHVWSIIPLLCVLSTIFYFCALWAFNNDNDTLILSAFCTLFIVCQTTDV